MTAWETHGLALPTPLPLPWAESHAALPVVEQLDGERVRLYFAARDDRGRARIGSCELDLSRPQEARFDQTPALDLGGLGAFDDNGVTTGCLVDRGERRYLYYSGWSLGVTVPFYFYVGCAISEHLGPWQRVSRGPILERDDVDPFLTASPSVLVDNGVWRMWYVSGAGWTVEHGRPKHWYHVKYAESGDGIGWRRTGVVCIPNTPEEHAIARPCVIRDPDRYRMWYCARGDRYRIRYAESKDGLDWEVSPDPIDLPAQEWDRDMQAYPYVFDHRGRRHMLYNGNGFGATGIGHATETMA